MKTQFYAFRHNELSINEFYKQFIAWTEVIDGYNGGEEKFGSSTGGTARELRILALDANSANDIATAKEVVREKYLTIAFLLVSDLKRYGKLLLDLRNDFAKGQKNYPTTMRAEKSLMISYD